MKKIFSVVLATLGLTMGLQAESAFKISPTENLPLTVKMSANRAYVVGTDENGKTPMVWNTVSNEIEDLIYFEGEYLCAGALNDVNDKGIAVGKLTDDNTNQSRAIKTDVSNDINDFSFLYYQEEEDGSEALAISSNGEIAIGYYNVTNVTSQACYWIGDNRYDLPNPTEEQLGFKGENTKAKWISVDGTTIGGSILNEMGYQVPVIWDLSEGGDYYVSACPSKAFSQKFVGFVPLDISRNFQWMLLQVKIKTDPNDWDACDMPQIARLDMGNGEIEVYGDPCDWAPGITAIANDGTAVGYTSDEEGLFFATIWKANRNQLTLLSELYPDDEYLTTQTSMKLCGISADAKYVMGYAGDAEAVQTAFIVSTSVSKVDPALVGKFTISPYESIDEDLIAMQGIHLSKNKKYAVGTDNLTLLPMVWNVEKKEAELIVYTEKVVVTNTESGTPFETTDVLRGEVRYVTDEGLAIGILESNYGGDMHAFYYDINTKELTLFAEDEQFETNDAWGMTADGETVIGYVMTMNADPSAELPWGVYSCVWTEHGQKRELLPIPTPEDLGFEIDYTEARWISEDGSIILGFAQDKWNGHWVAMHWTREADGSYKPHGTVEHLYTQEQTTQGNKYFEMMPQGLSANGEWASIMVQKEFDLNDWSKDMPMQSARLNLKSGKIEVLELGEEEVSYPEVFGIANDGTVVGRHMTGYMDMDGIVWRAGSSKIFRLADMFPTNSYVEEWTSSALSYISSDGTCVMGYSTDEYDFQTTFFVYLSDEDPQGFMEIMSEGNATAEKMLLNGQIVIIKNGVRYDVMGRVIE